jgi:WhiB family redox-sensing transcriptional regulator
MSTRTFLAVTESDEDWRSRATCKYQDPELFFPVSDIGPGMAKQISSAKSVCFACPVRPECLDWAESTGQEYGVWGGLDEKERRARRRKKTAKSHYGRA